MIVQEHSVKEEYLIGKELNIVDLGACLADWTLAMNNTFKIKKGIIVEANPTNFKRLQGVINPSDERFTTIHKAVTNDKESKVVTFYEDTTCGINGTLMFQNMFPRTQVAHQIETISLKDIINMFGPDEEIDVVKMDIEGMEYDILSQTPAEDLRRIRQFTVEFHDFLDNSLTDRNYAIIKRLEEIGYELVPVDNWINRCHLGTIHVDTLFCRVD